MAERRMFAKTIIDSDAFIDMPLSTQALYFHLSMRADDEGFVNNPKMIMRTIGASTDDLKVLMTKQFVLAFETGIIVIKHWKIHNYIRADRLNQTSCVEEKAMLDVLDNGEYQLLGTPLLEINQTADEKRKIAYKISSLPYSFTYKIRRAFTGKPCPVCGFAMVSGIRKPTVQHNVPISKGGEHELDNISVICHNCNVSIQDNETEAYNNEEVIKTWDKIVYADQHGISWFQNPSVLDEICVSQVTDICQSDDSIDKDSIGEVKLDKNNNDICQSSLQDVIDKWNSTGFQEVKYMTASSKRATHLKQRIKEHGLETVLDAIDIANSSQFLHGNNKDGWVMTFDWFIKPSNFIKVLEHNYDNRKGQREKTTEELKDIWEAL